MFFSAPKDISGGNLFALFTDECGGTAKVSAFLHVSENTVKRWVKKGTAPRAAVLALFWETNYGRSQLFTSQVNEIRMMSGQINLLEKQYIRAKDIITGLRKFQGDTANEAFFDELPHIGVYPASRYGLTVPVLPGQQAELAEPNRAALQA